MTIRSTLLSIAVVGLAASPVAAQTPDQAPSEVSSATRTTSVTTRAFDQSAAVPQPAHRTPRRILIGMGVGAAIGAVVGANICKGPSCQPHVLPFMAAFGGLGARIGAAVGAGPNAGPFWAPPPPVAAAPAQSSFPTSEALAQLVTGQSIVVLTKDGREYEGHFTVSGNTLVMTSAKATTTVPFDEIRRIEKSTYRIRFHSLLGLGIGAAVGAKLAWDACEGPCRASDELLLVAIGVGVGTGIGAYVGAQSNLRNHKDDIVYDAGSRNRTVAIAPMLSPTRKGVAVFMSWR